MIHLATALSSFLLSSIIYQYQNKTFVNTLNYQIKPHPYNLTKFQSKLKEISEDFFKFSFTDRQQKHNLIPTQAN